MNAMGRLVEGLALPQPYLLFLGDTTEPGYAKTAFGLVDWARDRCVAELGLPGCKVSAGLPQMDAAAAHAAGARAIVIGVANQGGFIPPSWVGALVAALEAGLDIISGMHARLEAIPELAEAAQRTGRRLINVRTPPAGIPIGTGRKRSGKRLLTVGTDCALGKKYTALALHRAFVARGLSADFRASGQTGILIAGGGIPMDAVVSDFEAGAAEILSPDAASDHWDVVEGQGSLFNPAYAAVSLGLLHGSQPDVFVVCHDPTRTHMLGLDGYALPAIEEVIDMTIRLGRRTNPAIRCAGVSLNTVAMGAAAADALMAAEAARLGLPVADPIRGGTAFEALVDACLA
ncbi:DUF1611 domain-containing protein [Sandarakinorhabdus sp.]|uniref:DUF1611 domain-containing protein n=1 Tax=Sandarakinorhabdus sp. TaxID=1916663 RepID=UPI0028AF1AAB|nr:DUF1611 domain-containing protein [Sandarakinorhabdus sp.]